MGSHHFSVEPLPDADDPTTPTRAETAQFLADGRRKGKWVIVARCDRAARSATMAARINSGREYGEGYEAQARQIGPEHRVYARFIG